VSRLNSLGVSKKQGTSASARQPKDAVPGDGTVRVPKYLINGTEFKRIDVRTGYKSVLGWRTVSAEAATVHIDKVGVGTGGEG
jgi:hypothetical protein